MCFCLLASRLIEHYLAWRWMAWSQSAQTQYLTEHKRSACSVDSYQDNIA